MSSLLACNAKRGFLYLVQQLKGGYENDIRRKTKILP